MHTTVQTNQFIQGLKDKKSQVGCWISLSSIYAAEVVAGTGFDWALIDMEHSPNDLTSVLPQLQVFAASQTPAIVRPYSNDEVLVKRLLDIGAQGLLFPMVQSVEDAERAVAATRYPPRGIRGVSGSTRANAFGRTKDYFDRIEDETSVIVQIETREALGKAEKIAAVDGVTAVFFGPADIAADIGKLGQPMHQEVWDLILPVANRLMEQGVDVGTLVQDIPFAANLFKQGFGFIACGADTTLLARSADNLLSSVSEAINT